MSVVKHFIEDSIKKAEIDEFLRNEFERAGYGGVSITKTPLGTHLVVYTMRPGMVIGRGGENIRELATVLEEKFQLPSPQISVAEIEIPELNAFVVASRIASALKRGVHYRRAGFWGLNQVMEAGALGAEVIISGKLLYYGLFPSANHSALSLSGPAYMSAIYIAYITAEPITGRKGKGLN